LWKFREWCMKTSSGTNVVSRLRLGGRIKLNISPSNVWSVGLQHKWIRIINIIIIFVVLCEVLSRYLDAAVLQFGCCCISVLVWPSQLAAAVFSDRLMCSSMLLSTSPSKYVNSTHLLLSRTALTGDGAGLMNFGPACWDWSPWSIAGCRWRSAPSSTLLVWHAAADSSESPDLAWLYNKYVTPWDTFYAQRHVQC